MEVKDKKVLLVEDDKSYQTIVSVMLRDLGFIVDIAESGKEALELFNESYNFILIDNGLPDLNGLEVCRNIREKEISMNTRIKIIGMSAHSNIMREKYLEYGMDYFLEKPLTTEKIKLFLN